MLEKAELLERHAKEVDEITETGVNEISELESKLEREKERLEAIEARN